MFFVQWLILGTFIFGARSNRMEAYDPKTLKKVEVDGYTMILNSLVFVTDQ